MQVRLLTDRVGSSSIQHDGEIVEIPDAEARRMILTGQAEAVASPKREAMAIGGQRTAMLSSPQVRREKGK